MEKISTLKQILSNADGTFPFLSLLFYLCVSIVLLFVILDLDQIDAKTFLLPFLDILRAEETSAVITKLALATIDKVVSLKMLGMLRRLID